MISNGAVGTTAYLLESNRIVRKVTIMSQRGHFILSVLKQAGNIGKSTQALFHKRRGRGFYVKCNKSNYTAPFSI